MNKPQKLLNSVLLIDDDQASNYLHRVVLKNVANELNIAVAIDGEHALQYITCNGNFVHQRKLELPNLIILDLNMPRMNGLAFLEAINHLPLFVREQLVILVLTGDKNKDLAEVMKKYDTVKGILPKPLDKSKFVQLVEPYFKFVHKAA